jgi:hypothetical protein
MISAKSAIVRALWPDVGRSGETSADRNRRQAARLRPD